jgi:hypothetical protein
MSELIDNRAHRIRTLQETIQALHRGASPESVKEKLKQIVRQTDASEIAAMEQQLIAEGMTVNEVRSMCNLHAEVLQEIMTKPARPEIPPGHPVDTFRRENEAIGKVAAQWRALVKELRARPGEERFRQIILAMRQACNELQDVDKHYARKENLLFSRLEKYGITGPSKVMWAKDDEARRLLQRAGGELAREGLTLDQAVELIDTTIDPALDEVEGMVFKEENILLPMAMETLSDEDWADIWRDSPEYGWCLVEPREGYRPPEPAGPLPAAEVPGGHWCFPAAR